MTSTIDLRGRTPPRSVSSDSSIPSPLQQDVECGETYVGLVTPEVILYQNPFDFDSCCEMIEHCLAANDIVKARHYREHAACFCPTTEEFWIGWIQCELDNMVFLDEEQCRYIIQLYKRAVAAVPQVEVWLEYLKFLKNRKLQLSQLQVGAATGVQMSSNTAPTPHITAGTIRRVCEQALRELGLHATEGPKLWSFYRQFEVHLLNNMMEQGLDTITPTVTQNTMIGHFHTLSESPVVGQSSNSAATSNLLQQRSPGTATGSTNDDNISNITGSFIPIRRPSTPSNFIPSSSISTETTHLDVSLEPSQMSVVSEQLNEMTSRPTPSRHFSDHSNRVLLQLQRIRNLFNRQMKLPLAGLPELFDEYRVFELELPEALQANDTQVQAMRNLQEQGISEWELRKPFEQKLSVTDEDKFETLQKLSDAWSKYIVYEKSLNPGQNHERVSITYLRACEDLGHIRIDLWYAWISWVNETMHDSARAAKLFDRAVRYHPEELKLWIGYIQCQLKKAVHPEPDLIRQVYLRGLRGLSQQRPEELLQFTFISCDCLWGCMQAKSVEQQQFIKQKQQLMSASFADVSYGSDGTTMTTVSKEKLIPSGNTNDRDMDTIKRNTQFSPLTMFDGGLIRDVFQKTERHFISAILMHENDKHPLKTKSGIKVKDVDIFSAMLTLWDEWLRVESEITKDFEWTKRVGSRLLSAFTLPRLKELITPCGAVSGDGEESATTRNDPLIFDPEALDGLVLESLSSSTLSPYAEEWNHVISALTLVHGEDDERTNDHIQEIRQLYRLASRVVSMQPFLLLKRWHEFEMSYGSIEMQSSVLSLLNALDNGSKLELDVVNQSPSRLIVPDYLKSGFDSELKGSNAEYLASDSEVVNVTLDQLRFRRGKRRRRLSESEPDAFSDASSDSGGFMPHHHLSGDAPTGLPSSPLSCPLNPRKRRRSSSSLFPNSRASASSLYGPALSTSSLSNTLTLSTSNTERAISPSLLSPALSPLAARWVTVSSDDEVRPSEFQPPSSRPRSPSPIASRRSSYGSDCFSRSPQLRCSNLPMSEGSHRRLLQEHGNNSHQSCPLTPAEIDALERAARATWDGHECSDPSMAPAVPPVTSCMSPLRRRSLSGSSTSSAHVSPLSLPSEAPNIPSTDILEPVRNPPKFCRHGVHSLPVDDEYRLWNPLGGFKRSKDELSGRDSRHTRKRAKQDDVEVESKPVASQVPRMGKHFLQTRESSIAVADLNMPYESVEELMRHEEESSTLFVSNLDISVDEKQIRDVFKDCFGLKEIRIVRDFMRRSKGFCYVEFESSDGAKNALDKIHGVVLNERPLKIQISRPTAAVYESKTLFISSLPSNLETTALRSELPENSTEELISKTIRDISEKVLGKPIVTVGIRLKRDNSTNELKGYGYVDFENEDDAAAMLKITSDELNFPGHRGSFVLAPSIPMKRHRWTVAPENKVERRRLRQRYEMESSIPKPEPRTLFVKNMSFKTTDEMLKKYFSSCGEVECTMICRNSDNTSKGFGFVTFASERDAFSGRLLDGTELDGRDIVVSQSHRVPTQPKEQELLVTGCETYRPKDNPRVKVMIQSTGEETDRKLQGQSEEVTKPMKNADFRKVLEFS